MYEATAPRQAEPLWRRPAPGTVFRRGARPSPARQLRAAPCFIPAAAPPPQFAVVPGRLDMWGNDAYGDCVSAEEAFAKACYAPEIFVPAQTVISWAENHGFLNGADLAEVLDAMRSHGFNLGAQQYNDGVKLTVDYTSPSLLNAAIATGPVKIAIDANALPQGAGNRQGWYAFGGARHPNTDHCVALSGYGTAGYLFAQLGVPLPSGLDANKPDCYLLFTWSTIGVVDHAWLLETCVEAWVRNPTTVGVPPLPGPTPPNPPTPPTPPTPPGPGPSPGPCPMIGPFVIDVPAFTITGHFGDAPARPGRGLALSPDQLLTLILALVRLLGPVIIPQLDRWVDGLPITDQLKAMLHKLLHDLAGG